MKSHFEDTAYEQALVDSALVIRDMKQLIRQAIEAIDRRSYDFARRRLREALDEMSGPQTRRERE
jgi:hypothetical protein